MSDFNSTSAPKITYPTNVHIAGPTGAAMIPKRTLGSLTASDLGKTVTVAEFTTAFTLLGVRHASGGTRIWALGGSGWSGHTDLPSDTECEVQ